VLNKGETPADMAARHRMIADEARSLPCMKMEEDRERRGGLKDLRWLRMLRTRVRDNFFALDS
jgi:hypothetical protein